MLAIRKGNGILWVGVFESPFSERVRFLDTMRLPTLIKAAKALGKNKSLLCIYSHTLTCPLEVNWCLVGFILEKRCLKSDSSVPSPPSASF